jgi:hypothetical protein
VAERAQRVLLLRRLLARLPPRRLPARPARVRRARAPVRHLTDAGTDRLAAAYVRLVLQVAVRDPGRVETALPLPTGPVPGWDALARTADRLRDDAGQDARGQWLAGQLEALATGCRAAAGERVPWVEQVQRGLQVRPEPGPTTAYAAAHAALEALLPGPGPLLDRLAAHRRATVVPRERLPEVAGAVVRLLRERTPGLPADEQVRVTPVDGAPWSALCRSLGGRRSEVLLDVARPLPAASLVALLAHETYPGHHTERCALADQPERQVVVVATPEAVVTEGLGQCALRASGLSLVDCSAAVGQDLAHAAEVAAAAAPLTRTKTDAALLLHRRGPQAAAGHLRRWGLHTPDRVRAQLAFLTDPRWAVHAVAYGAGALLVGGWLDAGGSYEQLLGRPVTPATLAAGPARVAGGSRSAPA